MKALLIILALALTGCTQIIIEERPDGTTVKVNTCLKDIDFDRLEYENILVEKYRAESKDVKAVTPYGIIETIPDE